MNKRNLFKELEKGLKEAEKHEKGKITLRTFLVEKKADLKINATLIRDTRKQLHLSRAVFAACLRVKLRTLEKWEQGITTPNDQAAALILMARKYPDTLNRLSEL